MMLVGQISNPNIHYQSTSISNHHQEALSLDETASVRVNAQSAVIRNEVPLSLPAGITQRHDEYVRHHVHNQTEHFANIDAGHGADPYPIVHERHIVRSNLPFRLAYQAYHTNLKAYPESHATSIIGLTGDVTYTAQLPSGWGHPISAERNLTSRFDMSSQQVRPQLSNNSTMPHSSGDLAILGAERYDVGTKYPSASRMSKRAKKTAVTVPVTETPEDAPSKKRRKASSSDDAGEEDERMKRGRGRPRLEPKDETAQDRRRTQIRLAQRAYRNRKESAIQTLERQVQELKETNEEMNNAFLRLHDFAVSQGLLDRMPDVGRQLRQTTQKFLKLARKSSTDDPSSPNESAEEEDSSHTVVEPPAKEADMLSSTQSQQPQLYGGFIVTQEPVPTTTLQGPISPPLTSTILTPSIPKPHLDYEVVTYPTLDNASFPFGFNADFSFSPSSLSTTIPTTPTPDFNPTLYQTLPLPLSHATQETTFGRRFQRIALERALFLVNTPDAPAARINQVFGFCLLFEPLSSIKARLQRGIEKTYNQSLMYWPYPFQSLGGAGGHFPSSSSSITDSTHRLGNQGTEDIGRVKEGNGFSMGPFGEKVNAARDLLEGDANIYDRFGGEFYDSDEIEIYLFQRGVAIPAGADYVAAEVDEGAFGADKAGSGMSVGTSSSGTEPTSPSMPSGVEKGPVDMGSGYGQQQTDLWTAGGENLFSTFADFGGHSTSGKRRLTVDVNRLIDEMVNRSTCLGRSPGLRKEEIDAAFWKAAKPVA